MSLTRILAPPKCVEFRVEEGELRTHLRRAYPRAALWSLAAASVLLGGLILLPFAPALLWGVVIAILFWPLRRRLAPLGNGRAAGLTTLVALLAIGVPIVLIALWATSSARTFVQSWEGGLNEFLAAMETRLAPTLSGWGVADVDLRAMLEANGAQIANAVRAPLRASATYLGALTINLVVAFFAAYFFLRDASEWEGAAVRLTGLPLEGGRRILERVAETTRGVFVGTLAIALLQAGLMAITLWAIGGPAPGALAVATFFAALVPILGAPLVWLPVGVGLIATGRTMEGAILLIVGAAIISQVDNLVRPLLVGRATRLHPLAVFVFILGGVSVIGPVGLVAGPMLLAILAGLRDLVLAHLEDEGG